MADVAARLKKRLGTGGSARGGEILIQGDCAAKAAEAPGPWGLKSSKSQTVMLTLQRASAGSGKTFTSPDNSSGFSSPSGRMERSAVCAPMLNLTTPLSHIPAVTFTNKATNEMQMRIVDSLHSLASYRPGDKVHQYMEDFATSLHVDYGSIARVCDRALKVLLANYSDFNVSTIDSFFQLVLRTFAYEKRISATAIAWNFRKRFPLLHGHQRHAR